MGPYEGGIWDSKRFRRDRRALGNDSIILVYSLRPSWSGQWCKLESSRHAFRQLRIGQKHDSILWNSKKSVYIVKLSSRVLIYWRRLVFTGPVLWMIKRPSSLKDKVQQKSRLRCLFILFINFFFIRSKLWVKLVLIF